MRRNWIGLVTTGHLLCSAVVAVAAPLGTAFTYQGQLKSGGAPVNDVCDFQFSLWDAASGVQEGVVVPVNTISVNSGLFTVALDFGVAVFNGDARWLQVEVRCPASVGAYSPLTPRQPLTPTPYAIQTRGIYVDPAERVGIGTISTSHALTLESTDNRTLRLIGPDGDFGWGGRLNFGDGNFAFIEEDQDDQLNFSAGRFAFSHGRVGIGTTAPTGRLDVVSLGETAIAALGNGSFREQATLRVENTQPEAGMAAYIKSQGSFATMHVENNSTGEVLWLQRNNSDGPFIVAHNADTARHVFSVSPSGYTKVAVLEITGGADLSEGFDISPLPGGSSDKSASASIAPQPGMVVSIDPDHPGKLVVSNRPYDRTVAGIVSGAGGVNPGMLMTQAGSAADGNLPVALSGRVYCLCDASSGAIRPGDLLTTSSRPGHAMKVAEHDRAHGAVIGKAMGSLDHDTGFVLVLVSLQ